MGRVTVVRSDFPKIRQVALAEESGERVHSTARERETERESTRVLSTRRAKVHEKCEKRQESARTSIQTGSYDYGLSLATSASYE